MKKLRLKFDWRVFVVSVAIVVGVSHLAERLIGLPYWVCLGIVVLAMIVNGVIAEWEDAQPGGFYNPIDDQIDR